MLRKPAQAPGADEAFSLVTTGELAALQYAAAQWLGLPPQVCRAAD